jgi:hypothetical protein
MQENKPTIDTGITTALRIKGENNGSQKKYPKRKPHIQVIINNTIQRNLILKFI